MTTKLYTVTLDQLATWQVTVAADSEKEAEQIAKTVLWEEAWQPPAGVKHISHEETTRVEPAPHPVRQFRVDSTYRLDFSMTVPASTEDEAIQHAKRLYQNDCGPFEFEIGEERVGPYAAEEVRQ